MRTPRSTVLLLLLAALLAACAAEIGGNPTELDAEAAAYALSTEAADAPADSACSASSITWSSPTSATELCAGPWEYERFATCPLSDPACGALECPLGTDGTRQWATCASWEFGSVLTQTEQTGPSRSAPKKCAYDPEIRRSVCEINETKAETQCRDWAEQRAASIRAGLPADKRNQVGILASDYRVLESPESNPQMECVAQIRYPAPAPRKDATCGCAVSLAYPVCPVQRPACGPDGTRITSAQGLTRSALGASDTNGAFTATDAHAPLCMSGEHLPMTSGTQVRAKYDFLRAAWDRYPTARNALARNLRQLYELRGDALDESMRVFVRALYRDFPSAPVACGGLPPTIVPVTCEAPEADDVRGALFRCSRLAAGHVPAAVGAIELATCLDALTMANSFDQTCGGSAARESLRESITTITARSLALIQRPTAQQADGLGALRRQLYFVDRWDTLMSASYAADATPAESAIEQRGIRSEMLGRFWRHALAQRAVLSDLASSGVGVENALEESTSRGLSLDRDVIVAAHTPVASLPAVVIDGVTIAAAITVDRAPMLGPLLLVVTADALSGLEDRLADLAVFHDFACQFARCDAAPSPTRLARFYSVLAALDHGPTLTAELAALPSGETLDGWRSAFDAIRSSHASFAAALTAAEVELPIEDVDATLGLRPEALSITRLVLDAERRSAAFASTGLLDPIDRRTLFAGVNDRQRDVVLAAVRGQMSRLEQDADDYEVDLATVVSGVLAEVGTEQARERIRAQVRRIARDIDLATNDIAGLQASASAEDERYGTLGAALTGLNGALDSGQFVPVGDTTRLTLDGTAARWTHGTQAPSEISVARVQAEAGELVGISSSGVWSPTCSLREVNVRASGGATEPMDVAGVVTGPEGFSLTITNGRAEAESASYQRTSTGTLTVGVKGQVCYGNGLVGEAFGVTAEACVYSDANWSWGRSRASGHSRESTTSWSSQFASGLRLPNTPFPDLPAGSLLVVETGRGSDVIRDVHVVRGAFAQVLVSSAADLYLVANDQDCGPLEDTTNSLTVELRRFQSETAFASAVVGQMAATLGELRTLEPTLVAQGTILPSQIGQLRSKAALDLQTRSGHSYATFPAPLAGLFEAFLDREMVRLERAVQIEALDRQLDALALELELLRQEELLVEREGRLAQLVPGWTLRNLDGDRLRDEARDLVSLSRRHLYPLLDLWYPESLDGLNVQAAAAPLLAAGPSVRTLDLVTHVRAVLDTTLSRLEAATPGYKDTPHRPIIAVSFVRPGVVAGPLNAVSNLPKADGQRSANLWSDALGLDTGTITLRPEDIYTRFGGAGGLLACTEAVPVIQRMALYVVRPGGATDTEDLNDERRFLTGRASVTQPFAEQTGPLTYTLGNEIWQQFQIPILYGPYTGALSTFVGRALASSAAELPEGAVGLSPFGSMEIDFQGLRALRTGSLGDGITTEGLEATEIVLVMQIDSRSTAAPLSWVPQCR